MLIRIAHPHPVCLHFSICLVFDLELSLPAGCFTYGGRHG